MSGTIKEVTLSVCVFIARILVEIVVLAVIFLRSAPFLVGLLSMTSTKVLILAVIIICLRFSCSIAVSVVAKVLLSSSSRTLIWRVLLREAGAVVLLFNELIGEDVICGSYLLESLFILLRTLFARHCIRMVLLRNFVELFLYLILSSIAL